MESLKQPRSRFRRIILIILDSLGIGALPDAAQYGDEGANTLEHIIATVGLKAPNLAQLGLCQLSSLPKVEVTGVWGRMAERSCGKDTTSGHWEIAGLISETPFPTYPQGFPQEIILAFEEAIGRKVLGNRPASGTVIIQELGAEHERTGYPIVYTSADSVFQIAAHEEVIPVEELYEMCRKARALLHGEHAVARVIARPFIGSRGHYARTARRKDFSLPPPKETVLDLLVQNGHQVIGIGKISDIFAHRGVTKTIPTQHNLHGIEITQHAIEEEQASLIFINLNDFDTIYGHRRDPQGYCKAIEEFDRTLPILLKALRKDDLLIITADHGNDPTAPGTDHTREYVPILVYAQNIKAAPLGTRETLADVGATIAENFGLHLKIGRSFLRSVSVM